jgi:hypothetical protein
MQSCGGIATRSQPGRLQRLSVWKREMAEPRASSVLVTEAAHKFSDRLTELVTALAGFDFSVADAAVLLAGGSQLWTLDAQTLSLKLHMLQSFFHPFGDASYVGKLPDNASHRRGAGTTCLQAALLCKPSAILCTADGLREYMRNLVALGGLFETETEACEACLRSPRLLRSHSWGRLVSLKAAVLAGGGAPADVRTAVQMAWSAQDVLSACLLRKRFGCAWPKADLAAPALASNVRVQPQYRCWLSLFKSG